MRAIQWVIILVFGLITVACSGSGPSDPESSPASLSSEEQAELVASALSTHQGGITEDITTATVAATGGQQQGLSASAVHNFSVSVTIDFYDAMDFLQPGYDPNTTDRIDYESRIQGAITNGQGYFTELSIDNRSDFTVDEILSRTVWINGIHTNNSSYSRTAFVTGTDIHFALDCTLILTDITVDLDAGDTFPESGTIEGSISGSHERSGPFGQQSTQFSFHFIATYLGDNTAEVELADGTVFIVQLSDGSVQFSN